MRAFGWSLSLLLLAVGCGGSSSETPPPLEPDPTIGRYAGPRMPSKDDDVPSAAEPEPELEAEPTSPRRPAPATWGSGKPTPGVTAQPLAPSASPRPSSSVPAN
jgi:hypothetical protein